MNIRRRSSVFVFYIIACNTAIWRYENKRVNLFWRDEESQPFQRKYASYELLPELATISWIACLLASAEGPVLHSLSPCQSSQVNWPQTLRGNYCTCSWSLSSINGEKWLPVPGFIGFVTLIAGFLIQDYVLLLSKWNSITRYPVIFNFRVGTGRVLEKKFGTGRVPGSRQTLPHSGRGEDFLSRQPDFFTETAVTPERKVEKLFPRWEINRHVEG